MKLLLISVYPPFAAPEANHALHISEQLAQEGVEVHVLCQKGSIAATHPKITLHPLIDAWSFAELWKVKDAIARSQPDAVLLLYLGWIYNQSTMVTLLPSIVARLKKGVPFITQFEAVEGENIEQPWRRVITKWVLSSLAGLKFHRRFGTLLTRSTAVIALSGPHREMLAKEHPGVVDKCTILPPPPLIRVSEQDALHVRKRVRTQLGVADDQFLFMFWGHIYPGKGVDTLLLAFERVRKEIPSARLAIVGGSLSLSKSPAKSESYYQLVRGLPDKLGIADSVIWTGAFEWDSEKGSEYLRAADACVLPLDWGVTMNNSSLAAAATHGLPVIAAKAPGNPDPGLLHGQNVYLFTPKDVGTLAGAMKQLAKDASFRKTLVTGSRALAEKWHSWSSVSKKLKTLLETASKQSSPIGPKRATGAPILLEAPPKESAGISVASPDIEDGPHPLVSVILAAYNVQSYLSQALDSLVHQTLAGIEIIAIDDASTDETRKILEQYAALYPNIRIVALASNVGLASVRNIGLQHSRGAYVMFLDGDDWADPRMCETLYKRACAVDADLVSASATVFYDDDLKTFAPLFDYFTRRRISRFAKKYCFDVTEEPAAFLLEPTAWAKIYRRSFLTDNGIVFEDGFNSYEDMCFHAKCMVKAARINVMDDPVVYYRQNRPGQISAMTGKRKFQIFDIFRIIHETASAADVPDTIWAQIIRLELKHFNWMLNHRMAPSERRMFMAGIADCLKAIPHDAWRKVSYWGLKEAAQSVALRRGWPSAYALIDRKTTIPARLLCLSSLRMISGAGLFEGDVHPNDQSFLPTVTGELEEDGETKPYGATEHVVKPAASLIGGTWVTRHRIRGQDILLCNFRHEVNTADALWRADHDHFLTQLCIFRDNDVVVEIGAHVGVGAIHLAKMFPSIRIYAVEPDKRKFRQLTRNLEINNITNVHPLNIAVGGSNGTAKLFTGPPDDEWSTIEPRFARRKKAFAMQDVEVRTLKSLLDELGISECRMLKVNAWGSVGDILKSIPTSIKIDYLCGEVDREDCNRAKLEVASWGHSRHHFWRAWQTSPDGLIWTAVNHLPTGPADSRNNLSTAKSRRQTRPQRQRDRIDGNGASVQS